MSLNKITTDDLANKGVIGLSDTPGLTTSAMQAKLEETTRDVVVPHFNALLDALAAATGAGEIGASVPTGLTADANIQAVLQALHEAKANKAETYTKTQTDGKIDEKMQDMGAGDMAKSVYDPNEKNRDIFAVANAEAAGMVSLSDATDSTSGATAGIAATPAAVKAAKDVADAAIPKEGGTFTGPVEIQQDGITEKPIVFKLPDGSSYTLYISSAGTGQLSCYYHSPDEAANAAIFRTNPAGFLYAGTNVPGVATGMYRNIEVRTTSATGAQQSTGKIIMVRK